MRSDSTGVEYHKLKDFPLLSRSHSLTSAEQLLGTTVVIFASLSAIGVLFETFPIYVTILQIVDTTIVNNGYGYQLLKELLNLFGLSAIEQLTTDKAMGTVVMSEVARAVSFVPCRSCPVACLRL